MKLHENQSSIIYKKSKDENEKMACEILILKRELSKAKLQLSQSNSTTSFMKKNYELEVLCKMTSSNLNRLNMCRATNDVNSLDQCVASMPCTSTTFLQLH